MEKTQKMKRYIEANEFKDNMGELAGLIGVLLSRASDGASHAKKKAIKEAEKKVVDKFKEIYRIIAMVLMILLPLQAFSGPPQLNFNVKEGQPSPITGKVMSHPEYVHLKQFKACCDEYTNLGEEIVRMAKDKKKKPLIGNTTFYFATIGGATILTAILTWTLARKHYGKK